MKGGIPHAGSTMKIFVKISINLKFSAKLSKNQNL
jgi:hypothetical protein